MKELIADKELVFHIDMSPSKLPDLVINNAEIATELLLCQTNTHAITKYYDELSQMKLSTSLHEVFNGLSHHVEFPKELTNLFVRNCMHQCRCQSNENKVYKKRMVRIVLVFLHNILKQKFISYDDIIVDIR